MNSRPRTSSALAGSLLLFASACGGASHSNGEKSTDAGASNHAGSGRGGKPSSAGTGGLAASAGSSSGASTAVGGKLNGNAGMTSTAGVPSSGGAGGGGAEGGGAAGGGAEGGGAAGGAEGGGGAGGGRGPTMVPVEDFYVDSTEVTVAQYEQFVLAEQLSPLQRSEACEWNDSVVPDDWVDKQHGDTNLPITGIDWCDAATFCQWAGKRLCGDKLAEAMHMGRPLPQSDQWQIACGGDEARPGSGCNFDKEGVLHPVASSGCESIHAGVFDLHGNVSEWVDGCDKFLDMPRFDSCYAAGGSARDQDVSCSHGEQHTRGTKAAYLGFRCCSR